MKRVFAILAIFLVFLAGCSIFSSQAPEVKEYSASSLKKSGATTVPTTEEEIFAAFAGAENMDTDPFVTDLQEFLNSFESKNSSKEKGLEKARSIGEKALFAAKDLVSSLETQIDEISEAIEDFPNTKKLDEKINVTAENIGTYLTFTKGEATLKANANTTDGGPIVEDYDGNSNLQELSGEASLKIEINPIKALYNSGSAIKDLRFKTNTTGNAKIIMPESDENPPVITLNYTESLSIGLSFSKNEKGGKFILTENAKHSGDIDAAALNLEGDSSTLVNILVPEITISLKVYDDNNQVKFSKTYNSIEEFTTAFFPEEPIE